MWSKRDLENLALFREWLRQYEHRNAYLVIIPDEERGDRRRGYQRTRYDFR